MRSSADKLGTPGQSSIWRSVGAPIVALMVAVMICGLTLLFDFAKAQDHAFADSTKVLVNRAIKERLKVLATLTNDYSEWDTAYQAVSVKWDQSWVEQNIYVTAVDGSMIYNPRLGIRYNNTSEMGMRHADKIKEIGESAEIEQLATLLLGKPQSISNKGLATIIETDGDLALIYMSPFRPTGRTGANKADAPRKDVAIIVNYLTASQLSDIGQSINLSGFRFIPGASLPTVDDQTILSPVKNYVGTTVGWVAWKHDLPGSASFERRGPTLLFGLALMFVLSFLASSRLVQSQLNVLNSSRKAAEAANRSKSEFLSNMSHELRTPLNSVIGYAEIIQEDVAMGDTKGAVEDAARIKRSATHLLKLINDLLDHSKIEAGKMDICPERTDLLAVVEDVVESLDAQAQANKVNFVLKCDPQTGSAMIDAIRFKQCLLNITGNAVKFTKSGNVTLAMRPVVLDGVDCFRIAVTDTGIGMTDEAMSRIFTPFEQADGSTTRQFGGTGLGLTITKRLVEAMDGQVFVESEVGKGSTFTLIFPTKLTQADIQAAPIRGDQIAA